MPTSKTYKIPNCRHVGEGADLQGYSEHLDRANTKDGLLHQFLYPFGSAKLYDAEAALRRAEEWRFFNPELTFSFDRYSTS